ncbi:MAG: TraR/DksA family transcriptional regulator [Acidimicrobiia bacterium]|nr:TraR/DksA family transcriptional regulator [Acidimicrobiia bacterium]
MSTRFDAQAAKAVLEEERAKLVHQLDELGSNEKGELRVDVDMGEGFADAAAITSERTERLGIADSLSAMLESVDNALTHIEAGTYGVCEECGKEIGAARLEARPSSLLCVDCKSKH